ncbi:hypothetical protein [Dyadobacter sp. BHUBP1]|uniref:hypothetical protein n=1 Tax=Dyadobacter sp. BHUBP1 TaxID=3424178 RepID=UPI003D34ED99
MDEIIYPGEEKDDENFIDALHYSRMMSYLDEARGYKFLYKYWGDDEPNRWVYHTLYEYVHDMINSLVSSIDLRPTYVFFVKDEDTIFKFNGGSDLCTIKFSTGLFERMLKIVDTAEPTFKMFPVLSLLAENDLALPPNMLIFMFGASAIIYHEVGHAAQSTNTAQEFDESIEDGDTKGLPSEEIIESHLAEWDADNFSSIIVAEDILRVYSKVPAGQKNARVLQDIVVCAMLGIFFVHNELSHGKFSVYQFTGAHPCAPYRVVNYCSSITSYLKALGCDVNEQHIVSKFSTCLQAIVRDEHTAFMDNMATDAAQKGYFDHILAESPNHKFIRAKPKIANYFINLRQNSAVGGPETAAQ